MLVRVDRVAMAVGTPPRAGVGKCATPARGCGQERPARRPEPSWDAAGKAEPVPREAARAALGERGPVREFPPLTQGERCVATRGGTEHGRIRAPMSRRKKREAAVFYLFIAPWVVGFLGFYFGPMISSLLLSFTRWDILTPPRWAGLANYRHMLHSALFWQSLKVTALYSLVSVPLGLALALAVAVLCNQRVKGLALFRTIFYLPSVVSGISISVLFLWVFNPDFGMANAVLSWFHIPAQQWLASPREALPSLIIMSLTGLGGAMIIFLAGLQGIPEELHEAAAIDGAGAWIRFFRITVPLLTPTIFFNLVIGIIGAMQTFTQAFVMTAGGPEHSTLFFALYLYLNAFRYLRMGYASALAWVLFLLIMGLTLLVVRSSRNWVYYGGA